MPQRPKNRLRVHYFRLAVKHFSFVIKNNGFAVYQIGHAVMSFPLAVDQKGFVVPQCPLAVDTYRLAPDQFSFCVHQNRPELVETRFRVVDSRPSVGNSKPVSARKAFWAADFPSPGAFSGSSGLDWRNVRYFTWRYRKSLWAAARTRQSGLNSYLFSIGPKKETALKKRAARVPFLSYSVGNTPTTAT